MQIAKIGKKGRVIIPAKLRKKYGLKEGGLLEFEERQDGLVLKAAKPPLEETEIYTPERKAEFLLNNAVTKEDYEWALKEVYKIGVDPEKIPHRKIG